MKDIYPKLCGLWHLNLTTDLVSLVFGRKTTQEKGVRCLSTVEHWCIPSRRPYCLKIDFMWQTGMNEVNCLSGCVCVMGKNTLHLPAAFNEARGGQKEHRDHYLFSWQ